ncbi:MAG: hypothetical protein EXQ52_02190 [Bryobacterales bacterium]|nr:hypothetical protein [Bryobacterales bacterium]
MAKKTGRGQPTPKPLAAGPGKKKTIPGPRKSTHKKRAAWFRARAAWPFRDADGDHLMVQRASAAGPAPLHPPLAASRQWESMGPSNVGGRLTSVVVHPTNPDAIWVGSAGGGVWRSKDGGVTWSGLWHKQESLNVGSLAIDARSPNVLYCGTGEANLSADSYPGAGIYRSTDSGDSWTLWAPVKQYGLPGRIGTIAVDPFDSLHIRAGGVSHSDTGSSGMFVTTDGGVT